MKKYFAILVLLLASYVVYDQIYSAKSDFKEAFHDFNTLLGADKISIEFIRTHSADYESFIDKYCNTSSIKFANLMMIEELLNISSPERSAFIYRLLKVSPPLTNSEHYSKDFLVYFKLSRMFEPSVDQIFNELSKSSEMVEFRAEANKAMSKKSTSEDFTNEDAETLYAFLASSMCGLAKLHLGVIGKDEAFNRNIKTIQAEIIVKNVHQANKALEQIEKSLGTN